MQLKYYPIGVPFPSEIETASKGIESLSLPQQALLKEGFLHPKTPIVFQKLKVDANIQRKSLHNIVAIEPPTNLSIHSHEEEQGACHHHDYLHIATPSTPLAVFEPHYQRQHYLDPHDLVVKRYRIGR